MELKVKEKIRLKIWEDVPATPIEVTTSLSDVAVEEYFFFTPADGGDENEERTLERKRKTLRKPRIEEPSELLWSLHGQFGKHPGLTKMISAYIDKNTTIQTLHN